MFEVVITGFVFPRARATSPASPLPIRIRSQLNLFLLRRPGQTCQTIFVVSSPPPLIIEGGSMAVGRRQSSSRI